MSSIKGLAIATAADNQDQDPDRPLRFVAQILDSHSIHADLIKMIFDYISPNYTCSLVNLVGEIYTQVNAYYHPIEVSAIWQEKFLEIKTLEWSLVIGIWGRYRGEVFSGSTGSLGKLILLTQLGNLCKGNINWSLVLQDVHVYHSQKEIASHLASCLTNVNWSGILAKNLPARQFITALLAFPSFSFSSSPLIEDRKRTKKG